MGCFMHTSLKVNSVKCSATRRTYLSNTLLLMAQIRVFKRGKVLFISVKT